MAVQQPHGIPQIDPTVMSSPRTRVSDLQRSDINQMSSGQLAKALGVAPEDRDAWNKLVQPQSSIDVNCRCETSIDLGVGRKFQLRIATNFVP